MPEHFESCVEPHGFSLEFILGTLECVVSANSIGVWFKQQMSTTFMDVATKSYLLHE